MGPSPEPDDRIDLATRIIPPFHAYGIDLVWIERQDSALLRYWRNHPTVAVHMLRQSEISEAEHESWLDGIDGRREWYSLIVHGGRAVGLAQTRNIDPATKSGEGGMTIWRQEHRRSLVPFRAAMAGTEWSFGPGGLAELTCRIRSENGAALRYNRALGYRLLPPDEHGVVVGRLTPDDFREKTTWIRSTIARIDSEAG